MNVPAKDREQTRQEAMGRMRELHERDRAGADAARRQRPWLPRIVGLVLALAVVGIFGLGLHLFIAAFQRLLGTPAAETPAPTPPSDSGAMPVYVVPDDPAVQPDEPPPDTTSTGREAPPRTPATEPAPD
jgi:hypothetical protein